MRDRPGAGAGTAAFGWKGAGTGAVELLTVVRGGGAGTGVVTAAVGEAAAGAIAGAVVFWVTLLALGAGAGVSKPITGATTGTSESAGADA